MSDTTGFDIDVTRTDGSAVVRVMGELDLDSASRLREQLIGLANGGVLAVTVDLAELDFIDSSGLSVLVTGLKHLRERGGDLALRSPQPSAMRVFEITGLTTVFAIS